MKYVKPVVAINLVPISQGGGLQNGLSFVLWLKKMPPTEFTPIIICKSNSAIDKALRNSSIKSIRIGSTFINRLIFELFLAKKILDKENVGIIFTLFGPSPLSCPKEVKKISGFAYSNLLQPEIDFWGFLPIHKKVFKKLIDYLRFHQSLKSDAIILETDYLRDRALDSKFKEKKVYVVKMAPSQAVLDSIKTNKAKTIKRRFIDIAYISGPHLNKRIHLLPIIFKALNQLNRSETKFRLITTLPETSQYFLNINESFSKLESNDLYMNVGTIQPDQVGELLKNTDGIINIALLESFSNNWVEAWAAQLPLITTDAEWARHSCKQAALYINPNNIRESAEKILSLYESKNGTNKLVLEGKKMLENLPPTKKKYLLYLQIINDFLREKNEI